MAFGSGGYMPDSTPPGTKPIPPATPPSVSGGGGFASKRAPAFGKKPTKKPGVSKGRAMKGRR